MTPYSRTSIYFRDIVRTGLELLCAISGHAGSCYILNHGPLSRLYGWALAPMIADQLSRMFEFAEMERPMMPEGMGLGCLKCNRTFEGDLLECPDAGCPLLDLPKC